MATQMTVNCTYNGYNAFNKAGLSINSGASWDGWNAGPNSGGKYGYAGVRATQTIRYAFVYKFTTPSWGGNMTQIVFKYYMQEELGNQRTVRLSLTTTDPTTSNTLYTDQNLPSDSGRVATTTQTVAASSTSEYTLTVTGQLTKNKTYYLVISPYTSSGSNYVTIPYSNFTATITYEADASAVSASDGNIGSAITINMTNDGLTHQLTYTFGNASGTIHSGTTASSVNWTPPWSLCNQIPSATSGQCTITCTTSAGTTTCTITLYVPDSVKPSISSKSIAPVNDNATVAQWGIYLQNFSKIRAQAQASASYSTIVSWRIDCGAVTFSADSLSSASVTINELSAILTVAGSYTATITVTDARGRATTATIASYTIATYAAPTATGVEVYRCTSAGVRDDKNGTYLYAKATRVYSQVGTNTCTMQFQYKERSQPDSSYVSTNLSDNVGVIVGGGNIDVLKAYNARIYLHDSLSDNYVVVVISSQEIAFNMKPSAKSGVAFGMYAQDDEVVELATNWKLRVNDISKILLQSVTLKAFLLQLVYPVGGYFFTSVNYANSAAVNAALGLESTDAYWQSVSGQFTYCWHRIS